MLKVVVVAIAALVPVIAQAKEPSEADWARHVAERRKQLSFCYPKGFAEHGGNAAGQGGVYWVIARDEAAGTITYRCDDGSTLTQKLRP